MRVAGLRRGRRPRVERLWALEVAAFLLESIALGLVTVGGAAVVLTLTAGVEDVLGAPVVPVLALGGAMVALTALALAVGGQLLRAQASLVIHTSATAEALDELSAILHEVAAALAPERVAPDPGDEVAIDLREPGATAHPSGDSQPVALRLL